MILILKLLISIISFFGFCLFAYRKLKININFIPIFVCSCIMTLLFITGLFNALPYVYMFLIVAGMTSFLYEIIKHNDKVKKVKLYRYVGISTLSIVFIYIIVLIHEVKYTETDDLIHWGLLIKEMFRIDSFPNVTTLVDFKLYPPGAAIFVYYATRIFGFNELYTLIAQNFLMLCAILPIFAFFKKKNIKRNVIIVIIFILSILCINETYYMQSLRVDMLLSVFGAASTLLLYYYRRNYKKTLILVPIIMLQCLLIKNSGVFFIAINTILAIIFSLRYKILKENKKKFICILITFIAIPILVFNIWKLYVKNAYVEEETKTSFHAMTLENYSKMSSIKNKSIINEIIFSSLKQGFNIKTTNFKIFLIADILIIFIVVICKNKKYLYYLLFFDFTYILYIIGMILMYVFSMSIEEAKILASFTRYQTTIIIYLLFTLAIFIITNISKFKNKNQVVVFGTSLLILIISLSNAKYVLSNPADRLEYRAKAEEFIFENIDADKSNKIAVYEDISDRIHYKQKMIKYILLIKPEEVYVKNEIVYKRFDYVIDIIDKNNMVLLKTIDSKEI